MDPLSSLHTFSLRAYCRKVKIIKSVDDLTGVLVELKQAHCEHEYLVLGQGSNTIFVEDYPFYVILNEIKGVTIHEAECEYLLSVGAGENWHELVSLCMRKGIGGFENLALIPGTVGAAPIQNIGAYGIEIEQFIDKVEFYDTQTSSVKYLLRSQCEFAYRDSIFKRQIKNHRIITRVFFRLPKVYKTQTSYGPLAQLSNLSMQKIYDEVVAIRQSKLPDPNVLGNAGSFFKNPVIEGIHYKRLQTNYPDMPCYPINEMQVKIPAAWLIDRLGFKGMRVGNIACHQNQALVLVNMGDGLGSDLLHLARQIQHSVKNKFAITLENEVRLMGNKGPVQL